MKKQRFFAMIGAAILMLGLAACGSWKELSASGSTTADRLNTNYANALPMESQLVLGTLELEGTEQAVDAATAAKLVPLYTLLEQMTSSGTSAKVEIDAVLEQIQATMTTDQLQAIAAMKLTTFDLMTYMGQSSPGSQTQTGTPGAVNSSGGDLPADPGGDGGAPPAGFDSGPGDASGGATGGSTGGAGSALSQGQIATLQAKGTGTPGFGGSGTPTSLINQLIQVLEKKTGSATPTP